MKKLLYVGLLLAVPAIAWAGAKGTITNSVEMCDPNSPFHCAAPDASGNVPTIAQGTATTSAPTYTTGTTNPLSLDTSGNLRVIGTMSGSNIGGYNAIVTSTPTVQNAAYSASNAIGGFQQMAVFRGTTQPSGYLTQISVSSKGGSTTGMTVYAFNKSSANLTSTCTDKSAFSLTAADLTALIPGFPVVLTPAVPQGSTPTVASQPLFSSVKNADGTPSTNITLCVVVNGSVTPASTSDLIFSVGLSQD